MLNKTRAYHQDALRSAQDVLDADGNLFSDLHRKDARERRAVHQACQAELDQFASASSPDIDALEALLVEDRYEVSRLERLMEGTEKGSFSREEMTRAVSVRQRRVRALEPLVARLRAEQAEPIVRHKVRGSDYRIVGEAMVQCETPLQDGETVTLYRDRETGAWYIRRPAEMADGRFEPLPSPRSEDSEPAAPDAVTLILGDGVEVVTTLTPQEHRMARLLGMLRLSEAHTPRATLHGAWVVRTEIGPDNGLPTTYGLRRA